MADLTDQEIAQTGELCAQLLCADLAWYRRRKMRVEWLDEVSTRVRLSVDLEVPDQALPYAIGQSPHRQVYLPVFVLRKAPQQLIDFDFTDGNGAAVSLPTRRANAEVSAAMLRARATGVLGTVALPAHLASQMDEIASRNPSDSIELCDVLLARESAAPKTARATLAEDEHFRYLARLVAWASLIVLPVSCDAGEYIFKLSYTDVVNEWSPDFGWEIRSGLKPVPASVEIPHIGAQSFHMEVHPPSGMVVDEGSLLARTAGASRFETAGKSGRALHLYLADAENARSAYAAFVLRPQRAGLIDGARLACAFVAVTLIASAIFAGGFIRSGGTGPTLLLFLPGLLATYTLQPTSHALTSQILRGVRWALLVCAGAAFAAAFALLTVPDERSPRPQVATPTSRSAGSAPQLTSTSGAPRVPSPTTPTHPPDIIRSTQTPPEPAAEARPNQCLLQLIWAALALIAAGATALTHVARQRAEP